MVKPEPPGSGDPLDLLTPPTRAWFEATFPDLLPSQRKGWPAIASGDHTLIQAPTGSGKTLAAFLWVLDQLFTRPLPDRKDRCRVVYISPLKALAHDIERNLRAPLLGIRHAAERQGVQLPELTTFLRTGDTPSQDRQQMLRYPADILITTPESLYLILTSSARETLSSVEWVILDEIHAVAGNKRGAHLALSLERMERCTSLPPQRIGLSATQKPIEETGRFLSGYQVDPTGVRNPRQHRVINLSARPLLEVELVVPVEDMTAPNVRTDLLDPEPSEQSAESGEDPSPAPPATIWTAIYPPILELIRTHHSTIIFANNRRLTERICAELNSLAGEDIARAHHGSVARPQRIEIEESLKRGTLKAVVATSSLELGIHMGAVDLVIQVEAPISVTSGLQRVGRSEHHAEGVSKAKVFPKYRGDLLVATVMVDRMMEGEIETTRIPLNPLDVLCQQIVAEVSIGSPLSADELYNLVLGAAPYHNLTRSLFETCLDMLSGRYPSDLFTELRPRLTWDRVEGTLTTRRGSRQLAIANPGTIPDRGTYRVVLAESRTHVGELDEEMVYESRVGDVFLLGTTAWRILAITREVVEVAPEPGSIPGTIPFWHGDMLGRSADTGQAIGAFIRELSHLSLEQRRELLQTGYRLDELAAFNLATYIEEELEAVGVAANDQVLVVQRFQDEIGDWRLVLLSPYGARVHAPWSMILTERFRQVYGYEVNGIWSDDGIAFRFPEADEVPGAAELVPDPEEAEALLMEQVGDTALFAARFREAAGRALLLPRRIPGSRTPLWLRRRRSAELLEVAKKFGSFPIVLETYREVLQDDFDMPRLQQLLAQLRSRQIRMVESKIPGPSPFASSLLFAFAAAYLYEGDAPLAERRAAALTLDRELLKELLDESEIREMISPEIVEQVELELQFLTPEKKVSGIDAVHDLLLVLGPLTDYGLAVRVSDCSLLAGWLAELEAQRRVVSMPVGGESRWVAIEDVGRLRDALGSQPPPGVPEVFLETVDDPLGDVVGRYSRTHGPFAASDLTTALGIPVGAANLTLRRLQEQGRVTSGTFSAGQAEIEWVGVEVLRRIKRRSLAVLRQEIEPAEPEALGRFLPGWQGIKDNPPPGTSTMLDIIRTLQGFTVPASVLEKDILGVRHAQAGVELDRLLSTGEIVWVGRGSLGPKDGKIALFFRPQAEQLLFDSVVGVPDQPIYQQLLRTLDRLGAAFFSELYQHMGGGEPSELLEALWDLVWGGFITNDGFSPVRAYTSRSRSRPTKIPRRSLGMGFPPHSAGRWSLVSRLRSASSPTKAEHQALDWAEQLLDRYGILTRSAVLAEGYPGGFTQLYPVLSRLEETGRIRRGYFVEGLGGAQFGQRGAVERLRAENQTGVTVLASTDPANPYGSLLAWPKVSDGRLARTAGAFVILSEGSLIGVLEGGGIRLWDEDADFYPGIAEAISNIAQRHPRFSLRQLNGESIANQDLAAHLTRTGFAPHPRGLVYRPPKN